MFFTFFLGVPLDRFPHPEEIKNEDKFKSWTSNIGGEISALDPMYIYNYKRLCRRHFEDCNKYPKNRLCKLATPVLHIPGILYNVRISIITGFLRVFL